MHIAYVSLESPYDPEGGGGIAAYLRAVIPALVRAGHRITVVAHARQVGFRSDYQGALQVFNFHLPSLHWYLRRLSPCASVLILPLRQLEWSLSFHGMAKRLLRGDMPDLIESTALGGLLFASRPLAPLIVRLHGSEYSFRVASGRRLDRAARLDHWLERAVWRGARALTSPSRAHAVDVATSMGWPAERISVIPNPVSQEMMAAGREALHGRPEDGAHPLVLYTGRLAPVKGIPTLLQAADHVLRDCPQARFALVGGWQMPHKPEALGLAQESQGIVWVGPLPWRRLADWYRRASVFVMPSYYETFCISCLEAMAFGVPVVVSRAGGLPEVVQDGETGLLVPPGNPRALAEAVLHLLRDPMLRWKLGRAAQERVAERFAPGVVVPAMVSLYESAVAEARQH